MSGSFVFSEGWQFRNQFVAQVAAGIQLAALVRLAGHREHISVVRQVVALLDRRVSIRPPARGRGRWLRSSRVDAPSPPRLLLCVVQGMRVLGKTGRSREEMASLVDSALKLLD